MYNHFDYSIQYKKPSNLEELNKKFFKVERDWCDSVRKNGYYIEIEASAEFLVTRGCHTFKNEILTENLAFLESVARQFSSLPIFVDCNKVRKHFE